MQQFYLNIKFLPLPSEATSQVNTFHSPPPDFHRSPSFHFVPKNTKTYTKSYKIEEAHYNVAVWF